MTAFDTRAIGHQIALVVDITELKQVPTAYSQLKATQTYLSRPELRAVLVAGNNKLLRLMMMLIFNLSKPTLRFFDSVAQALEFAESRIPA
ncbi:MAG: hypothetical protein KF726_17090 [Anaerolineae bacterium]|nr:hypothetical protein [Anaerolineae bacterium]